jgi:hypothetical protein
MKLEPADIIITKDKKSWFSMAILKVLRWSQDDKVKYQHAMLVVDDNTCIEALWKIKYNNTRERFKDFERYKIIRCGLLTEDLKQAVVKKAKTLEGFSYSYKRLILQLLDQLFHTDWFTGGLKSEDEQICSSLVAWAYQKTTGQKFNKIDWKSCEPDDIDDASINNPTVWTTILEWEKD